MSVIPPSLFIVMKRFAERKNAIRRLFMGSEKFRNICEDYQRCAEAVQHWNHSASEEAPARREEYAALLRDLEEEILENLLDSQ